MWDEPGHWPGCRQPSTVVVFKAQVPGACNLAALDAWLAQCLGLALQPWPHAQLANRGQPWVDWAWRVLQLSAFMQREARLPTFEPGTILQIAPDPSQPGSFRVRARVPALPAVPRDLLGVPIRAALQVLTALGSSPEAEWDREALYRLMEAQAIRPLRQRVPGGISTLPVLQEAFLQNKPVRHLAVGVYQLGWGEHARRLDRSVLDEDSAIGSRLANNKLWSAQLLRQAGLPAPVHEQVSDETAALAAAAKLGWPVVVKPADRERSEGVTVHVGDESRLRAGFRHARQFSKAILVERQVAGVCHRVMVANGRMLYAVRRAARSVLGDGRSTIRELIEQSRQAALQKPSWSRGALIAPDALCEEALAFQSRGLDDVPAAGDVVALRLLESTLWGGDVVEVTESVHPDNAALAEQAARVFGLKNAGVDIITPDLAIPWHENGAILNEVNFAPHFGGTQAARRMMPVYVQNLVTGDGRIPVEVFVGGADAWAAALQRQQEWQGQGLNAFVTSHLTVKGPDGQPWHMVSDSLFRRVGALLLDKRVGALGVVVQTDEWLHTGLPVDRINTCLRCAGPLVRHAEPTVNLSTQAEAQLLRLLTVHLRQ